MWPASAVHTLSGRSGKVDFCVLRVFLCKVQGARPREMVVLAGDGVRSFFSEFSAGDARLRMRLSQNFSQPNGDRPVPIGQREATVGFF